MLLSWKLFYFTLFLSGAALKFNTNFDRSSQKEDHHNALEEGLATLATESLLGRSAWALGGGGCHSMFAQQGFVRGFRSALKMKTAAGDSAIRFNYPVYQVTVSGGGWFWAALLSYRKYFKVTEAELYGMDDWQSVLRNNCTPLFDEGCCSGIGQGVEGCDEDKWLDKGTGSGCGTGSSFFFSEFQESLLEQASASSSAGGLSDCQAESAVDARCTKEQKLRIFGPCAVCANSVGYNPAVSTNWEEHTYKHYLEPNGLDFDAVWTDFGSIDSGTATNADGSATTFHFNWFCAWSNYTHHTNPPRFRVDGAFAHRYEDWCPGDPTDVSHVHLCATENPRIVNAISKSSNAPAAMLGLFMLYMKTEGCKANVNFKRVRENSDSEEETLLKEHDFLPSHMRFEYNAGLRYDQLVNIPFAMAGGFTSDRQQQVAIATRATCLTTAAGNTGAIATCEAAFLNHKTHNNFGFPTDNLNDQQGFLNLLRVIEDLEEHNNQAHILESRDAGAQAVNGVIGYGSFRVFPIVLQTAAAISMKSLFHQALSGSRAYFAPAAQLVNMDVPPAGLLDQYLCTDNWLMSVPSSNPNHGLLLSNSNKFWGVAAGASPACYTQGYKSEAPSGTGSDKCDNIFTKLKRVGMIYAEIVPIVPNAVYNVGNNPYNGGTGWKLMAISLAVQVESTLSLNWLVFADPIAALSAGAAFRMAAASRLKQYGVGTGSGYGCGSSAFFLEEAATSEDSEVPPFREGLASANDDWVQANMVNLRQSLTTSHSSTIIAVPSYLLTHFPAFPIITLSYLPSKFAHILDNYMSHVSYVAQCCLNRWQSPYCETHSTTADGVLHVAITDHVDCKDFRTICPFCRDHLSLCPCMQIVANEATTSTFAPNANSPETGWHGPVKTFIFPVVRFGSPHSQIR